MNSFFKEFREFALKGNVLDLAIGVIIGAAFGKIVTSLVNDILMPPLGLLLGNVNFADLFISLDGKDYDSLAIAQAAAAPTLNYGLFINNVIDFVLVAFVVFLVVKQINRMKRQPPPADAHIKNCPYCKTDIHEDATRCPNCTSELGAKAA